MQSNAPIEDSLNQETKRYSAGVQFIQLPKFVKIEINFAKFLIPKIHKNYSVDW